MKAVLYDAPASFTVAYVDTPRPGPGEVLIKVIQVGICGTDLHIHRGDFGARFPLVPGHELVGTIAELGTGSDRFAVGEQVTVNPNIHCGECDHCRSGRLGLCSAAQGLGSNHPGFFAEYTCVPQRLAFSVAGLPPDTAVFTEPAACAMHGTETLDIRPGSTALVIGAGPTGLLLAQLIGSGGASAVTVAGPTQFKLDTARALGIEHTVLIERDEPEHNLRKLRAAAAAAGHSDGYDIVVEATGSTTVGQICVPLTRAGGAVLIYGVTRADESFAVHPFDIFRREITVRGSFAEMTSFGAAIAALRTGRARTDGIITHRFGLDDYGAALQVLAADRTAHKVLIVP